MPLNGAITFFSTSKSRNEALVSLLSSLGKQGMYKNEIFNSLLGISVVDKALNVMSDNSEISNQYDEMGKHYLSSQETIVMPEDRWGRAKIDGFVGSLSGKVVMDAGCGDGLDTNSYLTQGAIKVLAFDPSDIMLECARERIQTSDPIEFKRGIFEAIPYEDSSADVMIGVFSLHYPADLDAAYTEIYRVMKPEGKISFVCTHPSNMTMKKKDLFKGQEIITDVIYGGTVILMKPSHTLTEYFSPFFFKHFSLDGLEEFYPADDSGNVLKDPTLIAFGATKK